MSTWQHPHKIKIIPKINHRVQFYKDKSSIIYKFNIIEVIHCSYSKTYFETNLMKTSSYSFNLNLIDCLYSYSYTDKKSDSFSDVNRKKVWEKVFSWLGSEDLVFLSYVRNFSVFCELVGKKAKSNKASFVWIETIWSLWLMMNVLLFNNIVTSIGDIVFSIKFLSWFWLVYGHKVKVNLTFTRGVCTRGFEYSCARCSILIINKKDKVWVVKFE